MSKYECPECCGEGFDLEVQVDSRFPTFLACGMCDGEGVIEGIQICSECDNDLSGFDIDPEDPYYEDVIERVVGPCCKSDSLLASDICSVQPMVGNGTVHFTSGTAVTSTFAWDGGQWSVTSP